MSFPIATGSGESVWVIDKSATAGVLTVVTVVAESLAEFGSDVDELTPAVFTMLDPPGPLAMAAKMIVADAPTGSELNKTVRLFPVPRQRPPAVAAHETNVRDAGSSSVTFTSRATPMPLFVTTIV